MIDEVLDVLAEFCINSSSQITCAESCTGGLVAKLITDRQGSSQWFERGFVTYSNLAKEEMLGVDKHLLAEFGAVSEAVAEAMAMGALRHSHAQFSLSITGIAGPGGGSESKPVGLVCFGWAYYDKKNAQILAQTSEQHFSGDRERVRNQSAFFALQQLIKIIKINP